jgi:hypothetical protein
MLLRRLWMFTIVGFWLGNAIATWAFTNQFQGSSVQLDDAEIAAKIAEYKRYGYDWRRIIRPGAYVRGGNYLNWSAWDSDPASWVGVTRLDTNGIVMVTYDGGTTFVYNPATIALHAFYLHSRYVRGQSLAPGFKADAEFLLQLQGEDGALRYNFDLYSFSMGWVTGQTQGYAISVWTRAYKLFGDSKYLDASRKAYQFMLRDARDGGCLESLADLDPGLGSYRILTEGPFIPYQYALDGSIFGLLGIYDWTEFDPSAMSVFNDLVATYRVILPYYDLGGIAAYDLQYVVSGIKPVIQPVYHALITALVWTLDSIAPDPVFNEMWHRWAYDVGQPGPEPVQMQVIPLGNGRAEISIDTDEPIRLEYAGSAQGSAWESLRLIGRETTSFEVDMTANCGFFRATRPFPIIDANALDGSVEIWESPSDLTLWSEAGDGGTVSRENAEVYSGLYSCRIDTTSDAPAGIYREEILAPNTYYFLEFWAKASASASLSIYFGPGRDPVKTVALDTSWTRYTVYDKSTIYLDRLCLYAATAGVSVYLDDIKLWQFGSP